MVGRRPLGGRRWSSAVWHSSRGPVRRSVWAWSVRRVALIAIGILSVGVRVVSIWVLLSLLRSGTWSPSLLLFVNGKVGVDLPQTTFTNLSGFLKSIAANQIVTNTTLPTRSWSSVFVVRKHFLNGIINLL